MSGAFHPRGLSRTAVIVIMAVVVLGISGAVVFLSQTRPQTQAPLATTTSSPSPTSIDTTAVEAGVTPLPDGAKLKSDGTLVRPDGIVVKPDGTIVKADGTVVPPAKSSK